MKDHIAPYVFKLLALLPLGALRTLGALMGWGMWLFKTRAAKITLENLSLCFPELTPADRQQLAKQSLQETAKTAMEAGAIWRNS